MAKTKEQFARHIEENQEFYNTFCFFAHKARKTLKHCAVELIFNQCRWYANVEMENEELWKVNNDWKPFYSRKYMDDYNCHGFFRTRISHAD